MTTHTSSPPLTRLVAWGSVALGLILGLWLLLSLWQERTHRPEDEALAATVRVGSRFSLLVEREGDMLETVGRLLLADPAIAAALANKEADRLFVEGAPYLENYPIHLAPYTVTFIDSDGLPLATLPRTTLAADIPAPSKEGQRRQLHLRQEGRLTLAVTTPKGAGKGGVVLQSPVMRLIVEAVGEEKFQVALVGPKELVDRRLWEGRLRKEGWQVDWERLGNMVPLAPPEGGIASTVDILERALNLQGELSPYVVGEGGGGRYEVVALPLAGPMRPPGVGVAGIRPLHVDGDRTIGGIVLALVLVIVGFSLLVRLKRADFQLSETERDRVTARLSDICRIARLGLWEWRVEERTFLLSVEAQRILGFGSEEERVPFDRLMAKVHPGDRGNLGERVAWPRAGDLSFRVEWEAGSIRHLRGSLEPVDGGGERVVGYIQDLTELTRAQAQLEESEQRYRELSMAATEGIVIHDSGVIVDVNDAFSRLMGGSEGDMVGRNLLDLAHPDDVPLLAARLESERDRTERFRLRSMMGETLIVEITTRSAPSHGRIVRMSGVRDVTRVVRADEEADTQRRILAQADRLRSLGTLVAGVAHEINNPNSFVMFNAPLIERAWNDATLILDRYESENPNFTLAGMPYRRVRGDVVSFVGNILSGSRRIQEIVEKLRSFVGNATPGEMELIDPVKVVEEAVALLAPLVSRCKGTVDTRVVGRVAPIRGRAAEIGQVVVNLLANALQALPPEGGKVTLRTVDERKQGMVAIVVIDEGVGIPPEEIEKILDPFYTTKRNDGGTGLGLSISHTIVEEHGGRLIIESTPGKGTQVTVRFPVATESPRSGD